MKDRFEFHEKAGSGWQGQVFKATDRKLERDVALKKITRGADAIEHAKAISRIPRHKNLVVIYDVVDFQLPDASKDEQFVLMEWLPGKTLKELLPWNEKCYPAKTLLQQVVDAAQHLHKNGFVHGDIHEGNVMFNEGTSTIFDIDPNRLNTLEMMDSTSRARSMEKDFTDILALAAKMSLKINKVSELHEEQSTELCPTTPKSVPPRDSEADAPVISPLALSGQSHLFGSIGLSPMDFWKSPLRRDLRRLLDSTSPIQISTIAGLPFNVQDRVETLNVLIRSADHIWVSPEGQEDFRKIRRLARSLLMEIAD